MNNNYGSSKQLILSEVINKYVGGPIPDSV